MTYSIVARESGTGRLGVAVQTRWFGVGTVVGWTESGVGVVATQSFAEPSYGPGLLEQLRGGATPAAAMKELLGADPGSALRQVAVVDARGRVAVHTGSRCVRWSSHVRGRGYSCQANMMENPTVCETMAAVYEATDRPLEDRMLAALNAAESVGGDIRGRQSAVMLVSGDRGARPWERTTDLRVDDHPKPLVELERLLRVKRGFELMSAVATAPDSNAGTLALEAVELADGDDQVAWFCAQTLTERGLAPEVAKRLRARAVRRHPLWTEFGDRLAEAMDGLA